MNAPGTREGRYEPLLELGSGGMATVSVGRARGAAGFSRLVALKRARAHVRRDAKLFAALEREARLASRIHHSNVVGVVDVVEEEGDLVLVLEYVEGVSLAELTSAPASSTLDVRTRARAVVRIVLDVAAGLHAAHSTEDDDGRPLGIVHRDVSPSNVLVGTDGVAKIADFGIAKSFELHGDRTETDALKGKVGYMAPEYIEHRSSGPSVDLFALAVVAWESLTGARLFRSATEIETLRRVVAGRVPELGSIAPELAPLDPVLRRALAVHPEDRPPSVQAFAVELESVARSADLVASHGDVASLVGEIAGAALAERRRLLARPSSAPASRPPPRGRDDVATASIGAPSLEPDERTKTSSRRGRRTAVGGAVAALAMAGIAIAASRPAAPPERHPRELVTTSPSLAVSPASESIDAPPPAPTASAPAASAPTASAPGATSSTPTRRSAPSRVLVPRKAPPNPYRR